MKQSDLKKAVEHNRKVLSDLGISLISAKTGTFSVALKKKKVKRKNFLTNELEEKEVYFITSSSSNEINFPADLLILQQDGRVSTKLEIIKVEYNSKGYIRQVIGSFQ